MGIIIKSPEEQEMIKGPIFTLNRYQTDALIHFT